MLKNEVEVKKEHLLRFAVAVPVPQRSDPTGKLPAANVTASGTEKKKKKKGNRDRRGESVDRSSLETSSKGKRAWVIMTWTQVAFWAFNP